MHNFTSRVILLGYSGYSCAKAMVMLLEKLEKLKAHILEAKYSEGVKSANIAHDELTVVVTTSKVADFLKDLRDDLTYKFSQLIDICGADYPERESRFEVAYHLLSMSQNLRIRVKVSVAEGEIVPSVTKVFSSADWYEREVWDMYGIYFAYHPDLRRILTDYGFIGYPMRKDFPLTGYSQVRYDIERKTVAYEPVKLTQEYRNFDTLSPWEGTEYILPGDEKATKEQDK